MYVHVTYNAENKLLGFGYADEEDSSKFGAFAIIAEHLPSEEVLKDIFLRKVGIEALELRVS